MHGAGSTERGVYQTGPAGAGSRTKVALLGAGTVGGALLGLLAERPEFELVGVVVRDPARPRGPGHLPVRPTSDPAALEPASVIVEVAGGTGAAADLSLAQLALGKRLVTANKAALAERWHDYLPHIREGRVYFEAAVMAGTPAVGVVAGALRGSRPLALHAVLNGTCNVILSMMDDGAEYGAALAEAQRLGFAEADPSLDVEGLDAAHKLAVLARLAFDPDLSWEAVRTNTVGITGLSAAVLAEQAAHGRRVRLVASVEPAGRRWEARVRPVALPHGHPLLLTGGTNALLFAGDPLGEVLVRGRGAGGGATASGVLADLLAAAAGASGPLPLAARAPVPPPAATEGAGLIEL